MTWFRTWGDNHSQWDSAVSDPRELKANIPQNIKVIEKNSTGRGADKYTKYPKFANNSKSRQEIKALKCPSSACQTGPRRSEKLKGKEVQLIFAMELTEVEVLLIVGMMALMGLIYREAKKTP